MVTAGRPPYDGGMVGMRASAGTTRPRIRRTPSDPMVVVVPSRQLPSRRLPRPVVWLLWLVAALLASVVVGFLAGLARPREPDPWSPDPTDPYPEPDSTPPAPSSPDPAAPAPTPAPAEEN